MLLKKGVRDGRLTVDELDDALSLLDEIGVEMVEYDSARVIRVGRLAATLGTSFFDAAFADLALDRRIPIVTADVRFARAVTGRVSTDVLRGAAPADPEP